MAERNGKMTKTDERRLKEGRGQKSGAEYQPWVKVQDFSSNGQSNRDLGWKTGRQHDLHSQGERNYFLNLEWSQGVTDIQEQFPLLPLEKTIAIAKHCGISHPMDSKTKEPTIMTTDFLITLARPVGGVKVARTVKPAENLLDGRVIQKFEIERRYWKEQNKDWGIVTEKEINTVVALNVDWVHKFRNTSSLRPMSDRLIRQVALTLSEAVSRDDRPLSEIALDCDDLLGLELGKSLSVARHMIASRQWLIDISKPIHPSRRLDLTGTALVESLLSEVIAK
jgi:hypothetical protein